MSKNLIINLKSREDSDGQKFYVGKLTAPVTINCSEGVTFLVFVCDDGEEQLQIALDQDNRQPKPLNSPQILKKRS